ncbi:MAG: hypothetical protein ACYTAF_11915, partial [Planctomycetota bacterium]
ILDLICDDLRNVYPENDWPAFGRKRKQPPAFLADFDANGRPRLRFVRTGRFAEMRAGPEKAVDDRVPAARYTDAWEVAYVMDDDAARSILHRGVRYFDREEKGSFFDKKALRRTSGRTFGRYFVPVDDGVLYVGFKFWTQFTNTWDESKRLQKSLGRSKRSSGPSLIWDSTRSREKKFFAHRKRIDVRDPDFVYPRVVQVSLTIESTQADVRGVELAKDVDAKGKGIPVNTTRWMPDAPNFVKIEKEWIEYRALGPSQIMVKKRGARGTKAARHAAGMRVHFGQTFTAEVCIPAYREAVNP